MGHHIFLKTQHMNDGTTTDANKEGDSFDTG